MIITIYHSKGVTHQPYKMPTKDIEDAPDWHLIASLGDRVLQILKPYLLGILLLYLFWPKEIDFDVF
jgi:hypothetical protein